MKLRVAITIDVSPRELWRVLERIEDHVVWMADAREITFVSRRRRGVGTEFDCVTRIGPLRTIDRMVITEWEPARAMGIVHRGLFTGKGRFTLRRRGRGRTRFVWREQLNVPWRFGGFVGAFVARPVLRALWRRNLVRLKRVAENGEEVLRS